MEARRRCGRRRRSSRRRGCDFGGGVVDSLSAAATYLGIPTSDLFSQLQSGKTLAQIANATSGKSASGLIDAMATAENAQIEQAVTSGQLTRDQADQVESDLQQRISDRVNGSFDRGNDGGRFGGPPPGGFQGGPPGGDGGGSGSQDGQTRTGTV